MPDTMIASPAPVLTTGIPAEIARAIGEVMTSIKSLPKGERNDHGGYNFASIDDFLAAVGPLCASAGLIVYQDEHSIDIIDRGGKSWVKATYAFRLGHTSGVICERPMLRTVFQAITGPQTMGSSQSYSLKQFLRSLFMIPTGDRDDADYHKPQEMPAQAPQKPPQRAEPSRSTQSPRQAERTQTPSSESSAPNHVYIPEGSSGLKIGSWVKMAADAMDGQPEAWRRDWLEEHLTELDEVRRLRPEWADKLEAQAIAPDLPQVAEVAA
jgi:ERF superfamily protein